MKKQQYKDKYKKPVFEKEDGLTIGKEIVKCFNKNGKFCMQCSACHGCR